MQEISPIRLALRRAARFVTLETKETDNTLLSLDIALTLGIPEGFEKANKRYIYCCDQYDDRDYSEWETRIDVAALRWGSAFALKMAYTAYEEAKGASPFREKAKAKSAMFALSVIDEIIENPDHKKPIESEDLRKACEIICKVENNCTFNSIEWADRLTALSKRSTDLAYSMAYFTHHYARTNSNLRAHTEPRLFSLTLEKMDAALASENPTSDENMAILIHGSGDLWHLRNSDQDGWTSWRGRFQTARKISAPLALNMAKRSGYAYAKEIIIPLAIEVMDAALAKGDEKTFLEAFETFCGALDPDSVAHPTLWQQQYDCATVVFGESMAPQMAEITRYRTTSRTPLGQHARRLSIAPITKAMKVACAAQDVDTFEKEHTELLNLCRRYGETGIALWVETYAEILMEDPRYTPTMAQQATAMLYTVQKDYPDFYAVVTKAEAFARHIDYDWTLKLAQVKRPETLPTMLQALLGVSPLRAAPQNKASAKACCSPACS